MLFHFERCKIGQNIDILALFIGCWLSVDNGGRDLCHGNLDRIRRLEVEIWV